MDVNKQPEREAIAGMSIDKINLQWETHTQVYICIWNYMKL